MDEKDERGGMNGVTLSPALLTALYADVLVPLAGPGAEKPDRKPKAADTGHQFAEPAPENAAPAEATAIAEIPARNGNPEIPVLDPVGDLDQKIRYLGENRRHICLVVSVAGKEILPARTRAFLEKMLAACQLGIDDLAIVNTNLTAATATGLSSQLTPKKWMLAGIPPSALGIELADSPFEVLDWKGAKLLSLPALATMETDSPAAKQLKRQLWGGLQKLFGL